MYPFAVATHSYFDVKNKDDAKRDFLKSATAEPVFTYTPQFTSEIIEDRLARVKVGSVAHASLLLVQAAAILQSDASKLDEFRSANKRIFTEPNASYTTSILGRIENKVTPETKQLWQEVCEGTGSIQTGMAITTPDNETFQTYRQYMRRYVGPLSTKGLTMGELLTQHLVLTGLEQKGWTVRYTANTMSARTNHQTKTIWIGENYVPRMIRAKKRIVLHEVYGHALRGHQVNHVESEGFALVLEQLTGTSFKYRRAYRYLAVALGWGVLGRPMTFREVFEILWRIMTIASAYTRQQAREHAFDEVTRAFRGGRPDIAGAVFLKDTSYFDGNIAIWDVLINNKLSYNEFIDIIEGRRVLLS
jgi:hypothetical protein